MRAAGQEGESVPTQNTALALRKSPSERILRDWGCAISFPPFSSCCSWNSLRGSKASSCFGAPVGDEKRGAGDAGCRVGEEEEAMWAEEHRVRGRSGWANAGTRLPGKHLGGREGKGDAQHWPRVDPLTCVIFSVPWKLNFSK